MKSRFSRPAVIIPIVIAAIVAIILISSCACSVPTGYTALVTTFGRVEDQTLSAGLHFKNPFQQVVLMDNREQKIEFTTESFSSDIQQVDITGSVNFSIDSEAAKKLYREVGSSYFDKLVYPRMLENIKAVFSKYSAENLVSAREMLSVQIRDNLQSEMEKYSINIISVSIENIDFTDTFTDAVEAKQVAAQKKLQAEIEQEQKTMETQQQAERQKIEAQAKADVQKVEADAEAYALRVKAEAEAEANTKVAESLTETFIEYTEVNRWNGELPKYMTSSDSNDILPVLNLED